MSVLESQASVDLYRLFKLFICDDDSTLFSTNDKLACSLWTVLEGSGSNDDFFAFGVVIGYLKRLYSIFL